jgi:hypothetical protein
VRGESALDWQGASFDYAQDEEVMGMPFAILLILSEVEGRTIEMQRGAGAPWRNR